MSGKHQITRMPPAQTIGGDPVGAVVFPEAAPDYGMVTSGLAATPADQAQLDSWIERGGFAAEAENG
jgi:hypothetical protein